MKLASKSIQSWKSKLFVLGTSSSVALIVAVALVPIFIAAFLAYVLYTVIAAFFLPFAEVFRGILELVSEFF